MTKRTLDLEGELHLNDSLIECISFGDAVEFAMRNDLKFCSNKIKQVTKKDQNWKNTITSTFVSSVIYLEDTKGLPYVLLQTQEGNPEDKIYGVFNYNFTL